MEFFKRSRPVLPKPSLLRNVIQQQQWWLSKRNHYYFVTIIVLLYFLYYSCTIGQQQLGYSTSTHHTDATLQGEGKDNGHGDDNENDIQYFDLKSKKMRMPSHLDHADPSVFEFKPRGYSTIDKVHREGRIHKGSWIYMVYNSPLNNNNGTNENDFDLDRKKLLILKRGEQLITCPGTWSLLGEHTYRDELPLETVRRGIREELGFPMLQYVEEHGKITNLTEYPIYYERHYGTSNEGRIDRQLTYLWLVELNVQTISNANTVKDEIDENLATIDDMLQLDDEVADHKWISFQNFTNLVNSEKALDDYDEDDDYEALVEYSFFCHPTIVSLTKVGLEQIREIIREGRNTSVKIHSSKKGEKN